MKEFVRNCTQKLAIISAHGCITSSTFVVPKDKVIVLFGQPGEALYNSFIQSLLVEKQSCLDVLAGKSCATSNGVPIYTVVAREGDVISDVMLKFHDEVFETGIFAYPLSETQNTQLAGVKPVADGTLMRLSELFRRFLGRRPGAYFLAACRDSCYQQALLVQKAQALDEVIRRKTPGSYLPPTVFHKNFTWFSTLVKHQRDVGFPTEIYQLLIPIGQVIFKEKDENKMAYSRAALNYNDAVLKSKSILNELTVYDLAEIFYLRDCLLKIWITLRIIESVKRKHGMDWSYGFVASSKLISDHVSNSNKLSTLVNNFNRNADNGRVMAIQRMNRSTADLNNSQTVVAAQKASELAAETYKEATYQAVGEYLKQVTLKQPWQPLFRVDGSVNDAGKLGEVVEVMKRKAWWKIW